jgi:hypothetical protein
MRVPGPSVSEGGAAGYEPAAAVAGPAAAAAAAAGGRRRTSVMPQRVLYQPESPPGARPHAGAAASGYGASRQQQPSLPNSPESCAQSEASVANSVANIVAGEGRGIGHSGVATRYEGWCQGPLPANVKTAHAAAA